MKTRRLLYLAIAAAVVCLAIAAPVLAADDDVPMWVERNRLAWCGRSSGGTDRVVAKIHIFDENNAMVEGAAVTAEWTLPDGVALTETVDTGFQGIAEFQQWEGRGEYRICVLAVTKEGWAYDPSRNRETCATIDV